MADEKVKELVKILKERDIQISVSESLTGGLLAATIVNVSGASEVFKGAVVAYSAEIKTKVLGVSQKLIQEEGTVCSDVAKQMAIGVAKLLESDMSIATTGVAGPGPYEGKEAGTVYVGIKYRNKETSVLYKTSGNREEIRCNTVNFCVNKALELLSTLD
ncbi:CinA family protein [Actinomyces sp. zg-332]|uniref:CinA family protein n=1 Tax=Actinomyces sp. zg-332 TaxID=2708340 RepID=UPI001423DF5C|nr:nicotinamide-nucleotide amidohydrolase family protein [Actinomyces sp. zg-332]QPK93917.1 CinA family protein [Actinomyces sp. zg-332]